MKRPTTVSELALGLGGRGGIPVQRVKRDGVWADVSYAELGGEVTEIALGLVDLGVAPGDRVCVFADTSAEWTAVGLAVALAGAVVVPIYPTSSPEECHWVANDSGAITVFCGGPSQVASITQVTDRLPALRHIIAMDIVDRGLSVATVREQGRAGDVATLRDRVVTTDADDPALIIYTSGTTGMPKGCVLTHHNLIATVGGLVDTGLVREDDLMYVFLPLAHINAQLCQFAALLTGATIAYTSGGFATVLPDCAEVSPTFVSAVPRVFEKLYAAVAAKASAELLAGAIDAGLAVRRSLAAGLPIPNELAQGFDHAEQQLFGPVRALLGGRLRVAITGAAPIAPNILTFFAAAGVTVCEGYGLSESTGVATVNTSDAVRIGTVGRILPGCHMRIADDGEILIGGVNVFAGYWNNPVATAETIVDGWLRTGDIGAINDDGYLTITGRMKDIIITAGGKNLTPANLENDLRSAPLISQAVMYGDCRPYPVALITLDSATALLWAAEHDLPQDISQLAGHDQVRKEVQRILDAVNAKYARAEQIKKFTILDHDFSIETGELTSTQKLKRKVVGEKYAAQFDEMYR